MHQQTVRAYEPDVRGFVPAPRDPTGDAAIQSLTRPRNRRAERGTALTGCVYAKSGALDHGWDAKGRLWVSLGREMNLAGTTKWLPLADFHDSERED